MSESTRDELAALARLLGAHYEWQRELGVNVVSSVSLRGGLARAAPVAALAPVPRGAVGAAVVPMPPVPSLAAEGATVKFQMPTFLRKGTTARPPVEAPDVAPTVPVPPAPATPPTLFAAEEPKPMPAPAVPDAVSDGERTHALTVLQHEAATCTRCRLSETRTKSVFARGNPFASVAFVGEGPGRDEDLQGLPFVGAAGKLLDKIIAAMKLPDDDFYICNVVKCRPPDNRVPAPEEMAACGGYLVTQLGLVRPKLIVALGKTAVGYLLGTTVPMSKVRGQWHEWYGIPLLPTWHPAYLLRQPAAKQDTWDDMKRVLERLGRPVPGK